MRGIGFKGVRLGGRTIGTTPAPSPSAGNFIPLSWTGAQIVNYNFTVANTTPYTYNVINRGAGGQSFNRNIFSNETVNSDNDFVFSGDVLQDANTSFFVGFGLQSETGLHYSDIDFTFWATATNVYWFESGVNAGIIDTIDSGKWFSYRIEYIGSTGAIKLFINNVLAHSTTSAYSSDTLVMKIAGRNNNTKICKHLALKTVAQPNRCLAPLGDSITDGTVTAVLGGSYIERALAYTNNRFYSNPVYAVAGSLTSNVISVQLPIAVANIDLTKTSNVATLMIGINDIRASVAYATIDANIQTIVTDLQTAGYHVVLQTILRDFGTAWADRTTLNNNILTNTYGADTIVDYTTSVLETDGSLFPDNLHPSQAGNDEIASILWLTLNTL